MENYDKNIPIMVTGATGYVAGWVVKELLEKGFTVHAPVRDPKNKEKLKYLNKIAEKSEGEIKYFKADLLDDGSYFDSMQGCKVVIHTASPFSLSVKNPQKDLIEPALKGTENVLNSVNKTESVKRVVLTSSVAAIYGDNIDLKKMDQNKITEKEWNSSSSLKHQPYSYSKTLAEKKAWEINGKQDRWDLVVINPSLVIGPGINPKITSESFNIVKQLGDGTAKMGVPEFNLGVVDVRDLAVAHLNGAFNKDAEGRYIISAESTSFLDLAKILKSKYGDKYPFPKKTLPKFMVWLAAPFVGYKRAMISKNVGYKFDADNSKSTDQLGVKYRKLDDSIIDFFQQMIDNNIFK